MTRRRTRTLSRLAALAGVVVIFAGCDSSWRTIVTLGAAKHASEHVAEAPATGPDGEFVAGPGTLVLCAIPPDASEPAGTEDHLWRIPSDGVAAYGCEGAWHRAVGTACDETGCRVNAVWMGQLDANPYQPLRATVDAPGHLG